MRIAVIAITKNGGALARRLAAGLGGRHELRRYALGKYAADGDIPFKSLAELTAEIFSQCDALIYFCACGIAVRMIAPHLADKTTDPAVVAIDEQGKYAVSLLSGHLGGANALAREAADCIGAEPVITTATDAGRRFSPDLYAQEHHLWITDLRMAKEIAAAVVAGERVGFCSEYPCEVPEGLTAETDGISCGIYVGTHPERSPFAHTLALQPRNLCLGLGCRRGIAPEVLEQFVRDVLAQNELPVQRIRRIASIDRKSDEPALLALAEKLGVPLVTYSAEKLRTVPGEFAHSDFVEQTVGVDNVCERSALTDGGKLLISKRTGAGVTLAVAELPVEL